MPWSGELSNEAARQLQRLSPDMQHRLVRAIDACEDNPFPGDVKPFKGPWHGWYRKRVGRYRMIFSTETTQHVVRVAAILARNDATYEPGVSYSSLLKI